MVELKEKKRKVSKKNKKSWRKHTDTKDVDKFLDDSRLNERLGSISDRKSSELFVVSTEPKKLSKKARRELIKSKEPRCFDNLKPHTAVPDPITKRNRVRTPEERKHPLLLRKEAIRKSQGILKLKERIALKNRALAEEKRLNKPKRGEFNVDVWEESFVPDLNTDWMSSDTIRHTLSHFGVRKKKLPTSLRKKPSGIPVIEVPHPGASYNPSYEDHQKLLHEVAEKEIEFLKEEAHLNRVTTKMFQKVSVAENEKNIIQELSEGLTVEEKDESMDEGDPIVKSVNPPVTNQKKTRVQRNKQKNQKKLEREKQLKIIEKRKVSDIYKLKFINKHLSVKEEKQRILREKRLKKKAIREMGTKVLCRTKFEPPEPDFKLSSELVGNLRNSAPAGNLLKDRFKSLQQRNIVAPSKLKLKLDKAKVKRFTKADHKIDLDELK